MRRRLKLLRRASIEISEAFAWWTANRPAAPKAFTQDLRRALRAIAGQPNSGSRVRTSHYEGVRRVHLSRIRYYLYYRLIPEEDIVEILALWHSSRGSAPRR